MKREVTVKTKNDCIGSWRIMCPTCPLLVHSNALGLDPRPCASGISTNMQGAITMKTCEHYEKDSIAADADADKKITLNCKKEDAQ